MWYCSRRHRLFKSSYSSVRQRVDPPEEALEETPSKAAKKRERAKMRPSLRYSILERDGFTCQLCGRSPRTGDNVKLHVDHILPISKGGRTEPDNLQVLCRDCNLGKGTRKLLF